MPRGERSQRKNAQWPKLKKWEKNKVILDDIPKYKYLHFYVD